MARPYTGVLAELYSLFVPADRSAEGDRWAGLARQAAVEVAAADGDCGCDDDGNRRTGHGAILELMCGRASVAIDLAAHGWQVTAIDLSPDMLAVAEGRRQSAEAEVGKRLILMQGDITTVDLPAEVFTLAFCGDGSWHLLTERRSREAALRRVHAALKQGGLLALELFAPIAADRVSGPNTFAPLQPAPGGLTVSKRSTVRRLAATQTMVIDEELIVNGTATANQLTLQLLTPEDVCCELAGAGFGEIRLLNAADLTPYKVGDPRMLVVARRAARRRA